MSMEEDAQLVVDRQTPCVNCGTPITSLEQIGALTPRGRTTGPCPTCRTCMGRQSTPVPEGMAVDDGSAA